MKPIKKYMVVLLSLFLVSVLLTGCIGGKNTLDKDKMDALIDAHIRDTELAISQKDMKKARDVWSKVTELSIRAKGQGYDDLAASIEKLSTHYVKLITYIETGEAYLLQDFRKEFEVSVKELRDQVYKLTEEIKK